MFAPSIRVLTRKGVFPASKGCLGVAMALILSVPFTFAQSPDYDPSWYDASLTHVKLSVEADGIYHVSGSQLASAGVNLAGVDPATLRIFESGLEIPLWFIGDPVIMDASDQIQFVGRRNTGEEEDWAYYETRIHESQTGSDALQSSQQFSLFTDTRTYWLTWGGDSGLRYTNESLDPAPGSQVVSRIRQTFQTELNFGRYDGDSEDNGHPYYTHGEGDYWHTFNQNSIRRDSVLTGVRSTLFSGLPNETVTIEARVVPGSAAHHDITLKVRTWGGDNGIYVPLDRVDWTGYEHRTLTASLTQDQIYTFNGTVYVEVVSDNQYYDGATPNKVYTDWFRTTLLRNLVAQNNVLMFPSKGSGNYDYQLGGFDAGGTITILDPFLRQRFSGPADGNGAISFGDAGNADGIYWAAHADAILTPAAISVDTNSDLANPANVADYIIITPAAMRGFAEGVASFHTSRNGYNVMVVETQDIFDQFDYGRPTPVAIRRFLQTAQAWSTAPRFVLMYGDARYAHPLRPLESWEVPTYGFAASDNWLVQGLEGKYDMQEFMAIGRVPLRNATDAQIFLNKLQNYYDAPFADWQQRAYYLTGGVGSEQNLFQSHSRNWAAIGADEPAGMDSLFFFKTSDSTIDTSLRDSIRVAIGRGASVLSYFGHSSSQTWEIVTDPAAEFDNEDRLPLVLSMGCRTGAFGAGLDPVVDVRSLAEDLLISGESGAIGHWGSSELGRVGESNQLSTLIHQVIFQDTVRTLGTAIQTVKNTFEAQNPHEWGQRHSLQYSLIGDPGVVLRIPNLPDFHVEQSLVRFEPQVPVLADSTVNVSVDLRNRGYYPGDSLTFELLHTYPDNSTETYSIRVPRFALADTLDFATRIDNQPGIHSYAINVDPGNEYDEIREDNNLTTLTHLVFSNAVTVVYPEDHGIATRTPRLRVSIASQVEMGEIPVHYELDTEATFDSPNFRTFDTTIEHAHADWDISDPLNDNTVYHWRATADDPSDPAATWAEAAFTVSSENVAAYNWMQQDDLWEHNSENTSLQWTEETGWEFVPYNVSVFAHSDRVGQSPLSGRFQVNGENYVENGAGFGFLILDGQKGTVKASGFGVTYPNTIPFHMDVPAEIARLQVLADDIQEGDFFFVRTRHIANTGGNTISEEVKDIFRDVGSVAIDTLTYDHLWLMKGRLGDPSETEELVIPPQETEIGEITWTRKLIFSNPVGETTSPLVGPAQAWGEFIGDIEYANNDSDGVVDVLSEDGTTELMTDVDMSSAVDLSAISSAEHPYLRLRATLRDSSRQTTPQLDNWRVAYTPVPDLVVDASSSTFPTEPLQEGESASAELVLRNLSTIPVQSANLSVRLTDDENNESTLVTESIDSIPADGSQSVVFDIPTFEFVGTNLLFVEAQQPELAEKIVYNNAILRGYDVEADHIRPVMTVSVDGQMLENAPGPVLDLQSAELPFISARPQIEVIVSDENPYLRLDDPTSFQLALDRLPLTPEEFTFTPATDEVNEARILFEPDLTGADTVHTFTVRAVDATGNLALVDPTAEDSTLYQVHFRVQDALIVESLYPYPNPMSRNTRLMFRMGGSSPSIVEDFRIRIYSVAGRLIREMDLIRNPELLERGGLEIGWNSVPWDGTDEDGDPVASGVYLYKVFVRDSEGLEHAINNPTSIERIAVIR